MNNMNKMDTPEDQGRVAILAIDMRFLGELAPDAILPYQPSHWDGDVWVQPETRFNIKRLLDDLCVPSSWHIIQRQWSTGIWIEQWSGRLMIMLASDSFPVVPQGTIPPYVHPIIQMETMGNRHEMVFVCWDMHEVEGRQPA